MTALSRQVRARATLAEDSLPLDVPPLLRRIYAARHITTRAELATGLDSLLPVGTLEGVQEAASLLLRHAQRRILIVGDFDADGATSTALMLHALREWGFRSVEFLVPDRFRFGYGLTPGIVGVAAELAPTLIVTVDNGISSIEGVAAARALGIDVLVTDHHLPGEQLPDANVIVNPNLPGSRFGSRALAGVGVAFYVLAALQRAMQSDRRWPVDARPVVTWLDLVALGTVADLVPLDANNRVLVGQGLTAVVEVTLTQQNAEMLQAFEERIAPEPSVQQCYRVSSGPDFVLIVHVADMDAYLALVQRVFTQDAQVRNVKAFFSVRRSKFEPRMSLR